MTKPGIPLLVPTKFSHERDCWGAADFREGRALALHSAVQVACFSFKVAAKAEVRPSRPTTITELLFSK